MKKNKDKVYLPVCFPNAKDNILIAIEICKSHIKKLIELSTSKTLLATKTYCLQYKFFMPLASVFSLAFLLSSCVSTVQDRIVEKRRTFSSLKKSDKELVERGKIRSGLSKDAVYIAWGKPSSIKTGSYKNKEYEVWRYFRSDPFSVYGIGYYGGLGYHHYGHRHRYYHHYYGFDNLLVYPNLYSYPSLDKQVDFINGRVSSWEANY